MPSTARSPRRQLQSHIDAVAGLLLHALLELLQVVLLQPEHARVRLVHQRLQYALVLHRLGRQHDLDQLLRRDLLQLQVARQPLHDAAELLAVGGRRRCGALPLGHPVVGPRQHRLELADLCAAEVAAHDHLHHGLAEAEEVRPRQHRHRAELRVRDDHVHQLGGGRVAPVVVLQRDQHRTDDLRAEALFRMVEAGLQQLGQIVVLGGADQARYGQAGERTAAGVQVVEQDAERVRVELDDGELGLGELGAVDLLGVRADGEARQAGVRVVFVLVAGLGAVFVWCG